MKTDGLDGGGDPLYLFIVLLSWLGIGYSKKKTISLTTLAF